MNNVTRRRRNGIWPFLAFACLVSMFFAFRMLRPNQNTSHASAHNLSYRIVRVYPHDTTAFTEGLLFADGYLFESTGLNGESSVRKVELETGRTIDTRRLDAKYFGEGLTAVNDRLVQLTFDSHVGFVYDRSTLELKTTFPYSRVGWGLTFDGTNLIASDGTSTLHFINPTTYKELGSVNVTENGEPLGFINELEYVNGALLANVFQSDFIVRINPTTGKVLARVDLSGLLNDAERKGPTIVVDGKTYPMNVLNGIAYDRTNRRLFVTGKRWPKLFHIELE